MNKLKNLDLFGQFETVMEVHLILLSFEFMKVSSIERI